MSGRGAVRRLGGEASRIRRDTHLRRYRRARAMDVAREAVEREAIRVVDNEGIGWPLVHGEDLANLYGLALERAPARSSYIGAAIEGLAIGRIARAFVQRFATPRQTPQVDPADAVAAELGEWAKGYALDQRLSGAKAQADLGWSPKHLDPEREIARLP